MTQRKPVRFIFTIPQGKEDKWRLYRKILSEFNLEPTERIWGMVESDIDKFMEVAELVIKNKGDREE